MALSIKDPEADRLAREVASPIGESLTEAVKAVLAERLARWKRRRRWQEPDLAARLDALAPGVRGLLDYDTRMPDEIVGHDENGMWPR
ncbi:MAG: type II toxin-antitoxin system VapB family antitoxin [Geminicoccaceae bacterium]